MLLDTSGFAGGIDSSVAMLGVFQRAKDQAFAAGGPKINVAQFQSEIAGINTANKTLQDSLKSTAQAEQQSAAAANTNSAAVRGSAVSARDASSDFKVFGYSLKDAGLAMLGMQGGLGMIQQLKTGIGSLLDEASKLKATNLGLENVAKFKGIPVDQLQQQIRSLDLVTKGILTYSEAAQGVSNLMRSGLNLEQSINLLKGFTDMAVSGRQASLELGYAVVSGTEGWRNNNNMLLDNMGMTTNIAVLNKRAGLSEEELNNKMNDSTVAARQYKVVMDELGLSKGNTERYADTFAGTQSKLNTQLTTGKQKAGELLQDGYGPMLDFFVKGIDDAGKFADQLGKLPDKLESVQKGSKGAAAEIKNITVEMTALNLLIPGLGFIGPIFTRIEGAVRGAGDAFEDWLRSFQLVDDWTRESELFKWLVGSNDTPNTMGEMGPELPPGFKRIGHGGEVPGHDIAGESTLSKKTKRTGPKKSEYEYDTDYSRLQKEIADTEKEFELLKTELTAGNVAWNENTYIIQQYIKALDDLKKKLADMKTDFVTPVNERIAKGSEGLDAVTLGRERTGIEKQRGDGSTPYSRFMRSAKTKEEYKEEQEAQMKQFMKGSEAFTSGLSGFTKSLGLGDTALGKFADGLSNGLSVLSNFLQMMGGSGGGGLLSTLFGIGTSFIPGASVVAGVGGGGGGVLGNSFNNYPGNTNNLFSGSTKTIEKPYIADFSGNPEEFRVMVKSADMKYKSRSKTG